MRNLLLIAILFMSEMSLAFSGGNLCSVAGPEVRRSENLLRALSQVPTPAFLVLEQKGGVRFVSPAKVYSEVLNIGDKSLIINDVEELRFLSQTLAHSEILLVLKETSDFSFPTEKAKKVSNVAKILGITINLVWIGEAQSPKVLRDLVQESGGRSFDTGDLLQKADEICKESLAGR